MHIVELELPFPFNGKPRECSALGIWERKADGEDGSVEVYIPGHRQGLRAAFGAEFSQNNEGIDQTMLVLGPGKAHYLRSYVYQG